jgi:KaiC/GvpD/RAD55 family RecA-like ATPase
MDRIPFGVGGLDARIGGGAPAGSVVLLVGDAGAGAREFLYTSAVINGLARTDEELFDLYYGDLEPAATLPEEVHYVSVAGGETELREEIGYAIDEEIVDTGLDAVTFAEFATEYFGPSPIPRRWYADEHADITRLGEDRDRRGVIEVLADYLDANADESLLLFDSLTDLISVRDEEELPWRDVVYLLKGIQKASRRWGGLILLHVSRDALPDTRLGDLMGSVDGTMFFRWETGGNERDRTLVVREFRGVLSRLEAENIVQFETEINDGGYDISNVRKIR